MNAMFAELNCHCESSMTIDDSEGENDNAVWLMVHRFSNAHVGCGFVTPIASGDPSDNRQLGV